MERIRYIKNSDGSYSSLRIFDVYRVVLSADQITGKIVDVRNNGVIVEVTSTSPHKTKIKIKDNLLKLIKVTVEKETRKKRL